VLDCWLLTVQVQLSHGKTTYSTIISKHSIGMREGSDNWDNEFREEPVNVFLSSVYMNGIYEYFFIICLYEYNIWMFFHNMCIWMEHVNVICIVCLYEWNQWMFSLLFLYQWNLCMFALSFVYINGMFGCFLRRLLMRIEYVNDFFIVCLFEWNLWTFL
jgi:hypothetical protein